jgi:hypothetical protein
MPEHGLPPAGCVRGCPDPRHPRTCPHPLPLQELERLCQVQTGTLFLGILGPVLLLYLYRNLRGCTRYRQVPWSSASSDLSSSSTSTEPERLHQVQTGALVLGILGPVLLLLL